MFQVKDVFPQLKKKLKSELGETFTDKQLEEITNKYYLSTLLALNSVKCQTVSLVYLGTFKARYNVLKYEIRKTIKEIRENTNETKTEYLKNKLRNMWQAKQYFDERNLKIKKKNENKINNKEL